MNKFALLLILMVVALPVVAAAHTHHNDDSHSIRMSRNSSFDIADGEMVLTHKSRRVKDRVIVTEDGDLTVNGDKVRTNERERKLLRKFFRESLELEEMAAAIAEDAEKIAAASTEYASAQVAAALQSLSDDGFESDETELESIETDFEMEMQSIEKFTAKIGKQADKVVDIASELQESIPELEELDWFLDD